LARLRGGAGDGSADGSAAGESSESRLTARGGRAAALALAAARDAASPLRALLASQRWLQMSQR
jgi:hypothetical protein